MKVEVGKKYVLTKAPSMFKALIGHTFEVTSVTKEEITLKESDIENIFSITYIAVSPDEFDMHFKQLKEKKDKKCKAGKWSDWNTLKLYGVTYAYKENGKRVIVRSKGYRGESSCHSDDEFNLDYGLSLALSRLFENKEKGKKH